MNQIVVSEQHRSLLEISRDIDRNQADYHFSKSGGKIHYLFDENVFEFFYGGHNHRHIKIGDVETSYWDKRHFSSTFHTHIWRNDSSDSSQETAWISINRQIALLTSEYLFSGKLPGQSNEDIYITQWHWNEFHARRSILLKYFGGIAHRHFEIDEKGLEIYIKRIEKLLSLSKIKKIKYSKLISELSQFPLDTYDHIKNDGENLLDSKAPEKDVIGLTIARALADTIVSSDAIVTHEMIRRTIDSPYFTKHLKPVFLLRHIPSEADLRFLQKSWMERFYKEQELNERYSKRSHSSIQSDAYSLAYIELVSQKLNHDKEQICLVTADHLVFDTYRRWWVENSETAFVLRRVSQYSPFLNFSDMESGLVKNTEVFEKIQMALEPALMFFNLGSMRSYDQDTLTSISSPYEGAPENRSLLYNVGREYLALALKTFYSKGSHGISYFIEKAGETDFQYSFGFDTRNRWRDIERLSVGINDQLIKSRTEYLTSDKLSNSLQSAEHFRNYINSSLDSIYSFYALHFVPKTIEEIRKWLASSNIKAGHRVPIAIDYKIPNELVDALDFNNQDIYKYVEFLLGGTKGKLKNDLALVFKGEWIVDRPAVLFAIATILALRLHLWEEAAEYAEISAKAAENRWLKGSTSQDSENNALRRECNYLSGLTKRFEMGAYVNSLDTTKAVMEGILNLHRESLEWDRHQEFTEQKLINRNLLYQARSLSEISACYLFFIGRVLCVDECDNSVDLDELDQYFLESQAGLAEALSISLAIEENGDLRSSSRRLLKNVLRQVSINTAAYFTLKRSFGLNFERDEIELFEKSINVLDRMKSDLSTIDFPDAVNFEINYFLENFEGGTNVAKLPVVSTGSEESNEDLRLDKLLNDKYNSILG